VRDFNLTYLTAWRTTTNFQRWDALTDKHLFDIIEPRHPCHGTESLEDVLSRKVAELKIEEKVGQGKEVLSRTWRDGSLRVRGAVGSAIAGLEQYRKKSADTSPHDDETKDEDASTTESPLTNEDLTRKDEFPKKDSPSFVAGWTSWAAEKRRKAFQKELPPTPIDIGPAPARPLAQWAASRQPETSLSPSIMSIKSSETSTATEEVDIVKD
jgi:hypothetical protein